MTTVSVSSDAGTLRGEVVPGLVVEGELDAEALLEVIRSDVEAEAAAHMATMYRETGLGFHVRVSLSSRPKVD